MERIYDRGLLGRSLLHGIMFVVCVHEKHTLPSHEK